MAPRFIGRQGRGQGGFILVTTLWLLAAATVALSLLSLWVERSLERTFELQEEADAAVAMASSRDTVLYLMAGNRNTRRGLGLYPPEVMQTHTDPFTMPPEPPESLRYDGTVYQGLDGVQFAIQDEAGLMPLNRATQSQLNSLMDELGIPSRDHSRLSNHFFDYIDSPLGTGFGPSVRREYEAQGRPPPPGRPLIAPQEARRVMEWDQFEAFWERDLLAKQTGVIHHGALNINAATPETFRFLRRLTDRQIERLLDERDEAAFSSIHDLERRTGVHLGGDALSLKTLPSRHLQLTIWSPATGRGYFQIVSLTPRGDEGTPWRIAYSHPVSGEFGADSPDPTTLASPLLAPEDGSQN